MTPERARSTVLARARAPLGSFVIALVTRAAIVAWAHARFAPAEDGHFYDVVARRIAAGLGYTWLWPDGAVTYAAHYPVGYPALLGAAYAVFGASPAVAMGLNALLGCLAASAAVVIARAVTDDERRAFAAGVLVALHPALVFYTPALMTEGVTASLLMLAGALVAFCARRSGLKYWLGVSALGLVLGLTVLVRPQVLLLAPCFGFLATPGASPSRTKRVAVAALTTAIAVGACLPWTARNCARMGRCAFVSANGGWNLLIGTAPEGHGTWLPLERIGVPSECRTEFREAFKDTCFGRAAIERIRRAPVTWLALVPAKLRATFEFSGAPGWYLHSSNARAFDFRAKLWLGTVETLFERVVLGFALLALGRRAGPLGRARLVCAVGAACLLFTPAAFLAYLVLPVLAAGLGWGLVRDLPAALAGSIVLATAGAHALFFGAGRYSLVCFPIIATLAATLGPRRPKTVRRG